MNKYRKILFAPRAREKMTSNPLGLFSFYDKGRVQIRVARWFVFKPKIPI
jgi:hypothetical protein